MYCSILFDDHPANWKAWEGDEIQREILMPHSNEYTRIAQKVKANFPVTIDYIERIQNPFLWGCYQLKKAEYVSRGYGLNEKDLFHCTSVDNIDSISQDNLDWRRFTRTKFGRGVSFSPSASYANLQANKFIGDSRAMIVAKVLVGLFIGGHEDMIVPPLCFDTTIGNCTNVYVKYADNEFYPEYVAYYDTPEIIYGKRRQYARENSSSVEEGRSSKMQTDDHFMQFFMQNLGAGYIALIEVFKYLKVQELLRAGRVCRMWHDLTGHALLWKTVRMKNSQVVDWKGCADSLRRYGTEELYLRKMLVTGQLNEMWEEFCVAMGTIPTLRRLELCKCPASVIERLTQECSQLQSITALALRCPNISLRFVNNLKNLKELRLKSIQGINLNSKLDVLQNLANLKHLSLTTFKELGRMGPNVIGTLTSLESLELGDFCDFPESFGSTLLHLNNLQRLRLENGQGNVCPTFKVLAGVQELPRLTQLELVNFDIKAGFDQALAQCTNLRLLLIIPTYVKQSATTNHMVLGGVTKLGASLVDFVWGVTHELLRVTELFVDQCDAQKGARLTPKSSKKNGTGESIPVLRPVPGLIENPLSDAGSDKSAGSKHNLGKDENGGEGIKPSAAAQQVDILPLSKLQTLLNTALPNAKVKILKIPFKSTWRQSIGEHSH